MIWEIFIAGAVLQIAFMAWYTNWRGPMKPAEIDKVMDAFYGHPAGEHTHPGDLRAFFESDDGREFFMVNYIDLKGKQSSSESKGAGKTLDRYTKPFIRALLRRGGHPVYLLKRVGGNVDTWNSDDRIDFQIMAMMRYRSRRDLAGLMSEHNVPAVHKFKLAAIERTISFPTQFNMLVMMKPTKWVPLTLLLACSLLQLILM